MSLEAWQKLKLHYFNQPVADADDLVLQEVIAAGLVPETCLLGGAALGPMVRVSDRPCALCSGPRERCGGSEKTSEAALASARASEDLRRLFTGDGPDFLENLLRRR